MKKGILKKVRIRKKIMKLIKIEGKPYEITIFQESPFEPVEEDDYKELNKNLKKFITAKTTVEKQIINNINR